MKVFSIICLTLGLTGALRATDIQGLVTDWKCTERMVKNGREKTLQQDHSCSMMKNYKRGAYGLITDDKKFYRLDDASQGKILELLRNTPDKDNLKVVVTGDVQGNIVKIANISLL